jgi:putative transcriptional regulator
MIIYRPLKSDQHMSQALQYDQNHGYLTGKLLVAMPYIQDQRFYHAVIYICGHDESGAMGLIINKQLASVGFKDLLDQIKIEHDVSTPDAPIYYGGPVEVGRGFVLHTIDYLAEASVTINNNFALTATLEILRAISQLHGPRNALVALGYVGWTADQLETEIQNNDWLVIDAHEDIIFNKNHELIWQNAMASIGVNPSYIITETGHA